MPQEYIDFEREEGALADMDAAAARVESHLHVVADRRAKACHHMTSFHARDADGRAGGSSTGAQGCHPGREERAVQGTQGGGAGRRQGSRAQSYQAQWCATCNCRMDTCVAADDAPKESKPKRAKTEAAETVFVDPKARTKNEVTAFVANLATATDEAALQLFFAQVAVQARGDDVIINAVRHHCGGADCAQGHRRIEGLRVRRVRQRGAFTQ